MSAQDNYLDNIIQEQQDRIAELEAENQRLREALQAVVDWMIPRTNTEGEAYDKVLAALEEE